ncbi:hypothetical protein HK100_000808 [Physocladia obscura]|uniref:Poly(ADP-ribose) glycohydrolase n=1 Tax=Physocladia obscura TaxID=109957 RepID=A0AAD5SXS9_9FUNG|nr:hypothetical protein HK100_000808 [Physocladia obscura]
MAVKKETSSPPTSASAHLTQPKLPIFWQESLTEGSITSVDGFLNGLRTLYRSPKTRRENTPNTQQRNKHSNLDFPSLVAAFKSFEEQFGFAFLPTLLPSIIAWASDNTNIDFNVTNSSCSYSSLFARYILANMFLMNPPLDCSGGSLALNRLYLCAVIDADKIYNEPDLGKERILCLLAYFYSEFRSKRQLRTNGIRNIPRVITVTRKSSISYTSSSAWSQCVSPLLLASQVNFLSGSMEQSDSENFVDFANKYLHIHSIIPSATQEEILFSCAPELFVAMALCRVMRDDEVLVIHGVRRYSKYTGYQYSFRFDGLLEDDDDQNSSNDAKIFNVLALDATMYNHFKVNVGVVRDLNKAVLAFSGCESVVTGHWGCGAFGGERTHKFIQQWIAASVAGITRLDYSVFGNDDLVQFWTTIVEKVTTELQWTVKDVFQYLLVDAEAVKTGGYPIYYKCPACDAKSCSVLCVRAHKKATNCTGQRNKTAYVSLQKYNESTMANDFVFLEDAARLADNAARGIVTATGGGGRYAYQHTAKEMHFLKACRNRRIAVHFMPKGMSRHDINKSYFHLKSQKVMWTVEWVFIAEKTKQVTFVQHDSVPDTSTFQDLTSTLLDSNVSPIPPKLLIQLSKLIGLKNLNIYLRRENFPANQPRYYSMDIDGTVKAGLGEKDVVEYPTFLISMFEFEAKDVVIHLVAAAHSSGPLAPGQLKMLDVRLTQLRAVIETLVAGRDEPKNAQQRAEILQGRVRSSETGAIESCNAQFAHAAIKLSDLLCISETVAARLLKTAKYSLDTAIAAQTAARTTAAEIIELLSSGSSNLSLPQQTRALFDHHLRALTNLPQRLISRFDDLKAHIEALRDDVVPKASLNLPLMTASQLKSGGGISDTQIETAVVGYAQARLALVSLLINISIRTTLSLADILLLLNYLHTSSVTDPIWPPLVIALFGAFQSFHTQEFSAQQTALLLKMDAVIFSPVTPWIAKGLQEAVAVQFCLFLKHTQRSNPRIEETLNYSESIESKVSQSLENSPFEFIRHHICSWATLDSAVVSVETETELEIREYSFRVLQRLVSDFFRIMGRVVRTMKNEAEDLDSGGGNPEKTSMTSGLKQLLNLVFILYRDRVDEGYIYWTDPDLFKFVRFMMDVRSHNILPSYLEILSAFATGPKSAQCALEYLGNENARLSWVALFRSLDFSAKTLASSPDGEISSDEVNLQRAFLRLLRQVVKFSEYGRTALYSSPHLQVINTLFSLLNRRIGVELKASIFDVIAAFCIPVEKGLLSDVAPMVWKHLEQSDIVPRPQYSGGFHYGTFSSNSQLTLNSGGGRAEGIRFDLEQIESQNQVYPETIAFMTLLNTLLFAIKPNQMTGVVDGFSTHLQTPGGVNHYMHFVIDDVFLKMHNRVFASVDERWKIMELSLRLIDQCLKSFEFMYAGVVGGFEGPVYVQLKADVGNVNAEVLNTAIITAHPGFSLMLRIMSGSPLLKRLLEIVGISVLDVDQFGRKCSAFASSIKTALRILLRAFHLQKFMFDVVSADAGQYLKQVPSIAGIDQHLAFYKDTVTRVALHVNCGIDDEICLLAINILTVLSQSPIFCAIENTLGKYGKVNRLVSLLSSSAESHQIIAGFIHRFDLEEDENLVDKNVEWGAQAAMAGLKLDSWRDPDLAVLLFESAPSSYATMESVGLANVIRLAILDLLLENMISTRGSFPTVAHYLLGYDIDMAGRNGKVEILEADSAGMRYGLHAILDLLRVGTTYDIGKTVQDSDIELEADIPLFYNHPKLSERCFRLLYMLCSNSVTSSVTMRFLRSTENFFYKQLQVMPVANAAIAENKSIFSTQLHQRSWLMQLIALELHVTTLIGQRSHSQKLLDLLFISPVPGLSKSINPYSQTKGPEQPLTKMLEILNSLDFGNSDRDSLQHAQAVHFNDVDYSKCTASDEYGHHLYDIRQVHGLLLEKQRQIEKHGNSAAIGQDRQNMKAEIGIILQELLECNNRTEDLGSRIHCVFAWCLIMRTAFGQSFDLLPAELREDKSCELLSTIFPKFNSPNASHEIIEYISHVILELIHRLRDDRRCQAMLRTAAGMKSRGSAKLPANVESFQRDVLGGLLDGILRPDSTPSLRENLYSALLHYLSYTNPEDGSEDALVGTASILVGNLTIISQQGGDKLLDIVCRDAATADRVLKTVAFSLLEELVNLASFGGSTNVFGEKGNSVLTFMVKRNFLSGFISSIGKQEDAAIQSLMQSEPAPENWPYLYIFEGKMGLLLRIAYYRDGIEKLLEAGLLEVLIDCKFIDERPDNEVDLMESDQNLLESTEIYYMTTTPILELLLCIVSFFRENVPVIQRVSQFLYEHKDAFVSIFIKNKKALESAASMKEMELATSFVSYLGTNSQLREAGIRGAGYTSFHNLLISLLAHYLTLEVDGRTNTEARDQERHIQVVCRNLLAYCETVTCPESSEGPRDLNIQFVFTPVADIGQKQEKSRLSISGILKSLSRFSEQYSKAVDEYGVINHKIGDISRLGVDEINEIAKRAGIPSVEEFNTQQRQQVAIGELTSDAKKRWQDESSDRYH